MLGEGKCARVVLLVLGLLMPPVSLDCELTRVSQHPLGRTGRPEWAGFGYVSSSR